MSVGGAIIFTICMMGALALGIILFSMFISFLVDVIDNWDKKRQRKKEAKKMPFHSSEFEYTPDKDDLTPQQRITLLEEHNTALRRRLDRLETELSRQVTALHAYLKVEYQYTPAERRLVKVKKASK